jgi:hypothetical protein
MVNTDKIRVYPDEKKFMNDICGVAGISHAELVKKVLNSDALKNPKGLSPKDAIKEWAKQELDEKRRRMG